MWKNIVIRLRGKVFMNQETELLDRMGAEKWELVTVLAYNNIRDYYFKRLVPIEEKSNEQQKT